MLSLHSGDPGFSESKPFGCKGFSQFDSIVLEGYQLGVLFSFNVLIFRWNKIFRGANHVF